MMISVIIMSFYWWSRFIFMMLLVSLCVFGDDSARIDVSQLRLFRMTLYRKQDINNSYNTPSVNRSFFKALETCIIHGMCLMNYRWVKHDNSAVTATFSQSTLDTPSFFKWWRTHYVTHMCSHWIELVASLRDMSFVRWNEHELKT